MDPFTPSDWVSQVMGIGAPIIFVTARNSNGERRSGIKYPAKKKRMSGYKINLKTTKGKWCSLPGKE
jgi:hypothetical protein